MDLPQYSARIISVIRKDGLIALGVKIVKRLRLMALPYFDFWYDLKNGVDTCAVTFHSDDPYLDAARNTAVRYEPTSVRAVRSIIERIPIDFSKYTFIDFGSGKGRVLLIASEHSFNRIIGVELSKNLNQIAKRNFANFKKKENQKCINVELCCADAAEFILPNTPLVVFFFTPFFGIVMNKVINNIRESLYVNPRPMHIIYYGSRDEIVRQIRELDFRHQIIFSGRPFSASGKYRAHLFSFYAKGV